MWVASRAFRYRGTSYAIGDTVPAEGWRNRVALSKMHRIKFVADPPPPPVDFHTLNRDELNVYALENGIEDPTSYKKKDELVAALEALAEAETKSTEDAAQPPANSVDASLIPIEDDLFAGLDDPVTPEIEDTTPDPFEANGDEESTEDVEGETEESSDTI